MVRFRLAAHSSTIILAGKIGVSLSRGLLQHCVTRKWACWALRRWAVQVVQWLLANNYLMTALELLVEAQEVGREDEVDGLQIFFSDRQKFPPEELVKFDQKDGKLLH